jgi:hypothetical protein
MAKQSGLGDQLFIGGRDVGADISAIGSLATPRETLPATGITQSAMARMFGKRDGQAEFTSYFNDATDQEHEALKGLPRTDVHVMYCRGEGIGNEAFCIVGKQVDYAFNRGDDGSLLMTTPVPGAAYGADWADQLTGGKDTHASGASTTSLDLGAAFSFGWQAYLQVFSLGSGTAEIDIEGSSDNGSGDAFAAITDGAFTNVTGRTVERIQSASATQAVERYIRVTTSGTFTDLVFAVAINVNRNTRAL